MFIANKDLVKSRMNLCRNCQYFVKKTGTCGTLALGQRTVYQGRKVKLCGCIMELKTKLRASKCPIDRWPSMVRPQDIDAAKALLSEVGAKKNIVGNERKQLFALYESVLGVKKPMTACAPCLKDMLKDLQTAVNQHEQDGEYN